MSSLLFGAVALALSPCPADDLFAAACATALSDDQLAAATAGWDVYGPSRRALRQAETLGAQPVRLNVSEAGYAQSIILSDLEGEALSKMAREAIAAAAPGWQQTIEPGSGTATITTDIRTGTISIDGMRIDGLNIRS